MLSRILKTDVLDFHILEAGEGPLVLMLHGFPDLAAGWTQQIGAVAAAGYHVVAPDLRGYGGTGGPDDANAYSMATLVGDIVAIVEALDGERAVVIGHDWGAALAWQCALLRPDMFQAVMALSVPFQARRSNGPPTEVMRYLSEREGLGELYLSSFKAEQAHEMLDADPESALRKIFWSFDGATAAEDRSTGFHPQGGNLLDTISEEAVLPPWMTPEHFANYVVAFQQGGFRRPVHWYRQIDDNWHRSRWMQGCKVQVPACYMVGEHDPTRHYMERNEAELARWVPKLVRSTVVPGAGHWLQQERPDTVNEAILGFLWELSLAADGLQPASGV